MLYIKNQHEPAKTGYERPGVTGCKHHKAIITDVYVKDLLCCSLWDKYLVDIISFILQEILGVKTYCPHFIDFKNHLPF